MVFVELIRNEVNDAPDEVSDHHRNYHKSEDIVHVQNEILLHDSLVIAILFLARF
jgi:hypothetical protein